MLRKKELYANPKKCTFFTVQVPFLGFIVSANGVSEDPEKFQVINEWPEPKNIRDVRSIHRLATFYRHFIKGFSTIMAPITDRLKKDEFERSHTATKASQKNKERMINVHVMCLPDFHKVFEVASDASGVGIT